jgi:hypothetical protein
MQTSQKCKLSEGQNGMSGQDRANNPNRRPSILAAKPTGYTPKGNYESVNSQGSSSSVVSTPVADPHKYRLTSYGDD